MTNIVWQYPLEFAKTRVQLRAEKGVPTPRNPFRVVTQVYQNEGIRALYKGCGALVVVSKLLPIVCFPYCLLSPSLLSTGASFFCALGLAFPKYSELQTSPPTRNTGLNSQRWRPLPLLRSNQGILRRSGDRHPKPSSQPPSWHDRRGGSIHYCSHSY